MPDTRIWSLAASCLTLAALTSASVALADGAPPSAEGAAKRCALAPGGVKAREVNNIEAIIDDSTSMRKTDPNRLRVAGLELFINDPDNAERTLGVVEFAGFASTVFPPMTIGPNRDFMISRLRERVVSDVRGTNYDAGFNLAKSDNPGAEAWIFLSDGVPATFTDSHRGGPRTFLVGLGIGEAGEGDSNANRLQRIANENRGVYFPDVAAATLQPTFKTISAAVNCLPRPRQFRSRMFWRKGQERTRRVPVPRGRKQLEMTLTWANPRNQFAVTKIELITARDRVLANLTGRGRPRKLKIDRARATTSRTLRFTKPRLATRLRFTVKARKLKRPSRTIMLLGER